MYDSKCDWEDEQLLFPIPEDEDSLDESNEITISTYQIPAHTGKRKDSLWNFNYSSALFNEIRRIWVWISFASCLEFILVNFIENWRRKPFSFSTVKVMCLFCLMNALVLTVEGAIEVGKILKTFFLIPSETFRMKIQIFIAKTQLELVFAHFFLLAEGINFLCCSFHLCSSEEAFKIENLSESQNLLYSCFFLTLIPMVLFSFNANRYAFK